LLDVQLDAANKLVPEMSDEFGHAVFYSKQVFRSTSMIACLGDVGQSLAGIPVGELGSQHK
jgi:hypothetical protein